jgi:hypothetical protein
MPTWASSAIASIYRYFRAYPANKPSAARKARPAKETLTGAEARDDSATDQLVLEGLTGQPASKDGLRIWAGRIADSFYIDLSLLGIVNGAIKNGTAVDLPAWRPDDISLSS